MSDSLVPNMPLESRETLLSNFRQFQLNLRSIMPSKPPDSTLSLPESQSDPSTSSPVLAAPLLSPVLEKVPSSELISTASIFPALDFIETSNESQQPFQQATKRRGRPRKQPPAPLVLNPTQNPHPLVFND